jgi:hypothetical protein
MSDHCEACGHALIFHKNCEVGGHCTVMGCDCVDGEVREAQMNSQDNKRLEETEREFGFVEALKVATRVFDKYKQDQPSMWKRMDGTPILNDVAVRMAEAFLTAIRCEFLCGVHADLDKSGKLRPFRNCLACIRNENTELEAERDALRAQVEQMRTALQCVWAGVGDNLRASLENAGLRDERVCVLVVMVGGLRRVKAALSTPAAPNECVKKLEGR